MSTDKPTTAEQFAAYFEAHMSTRDLFADTTTDTDTEENEQ